MEQGASIVQVIFAFLFVVSLIGLCAVALRKFGMPQKWLMQNKDNARLRIQEICFIDPKHKLVLIQRDQVEHLLLLTNDQQMVIESNIMLKKENI